LILFSDRCRQKDAFVIYRPTITYSEADLGFLDGGDFGNTTRTEGSDLAGEFYAF